MEANSCRSFSTTALEVKYTKYSSFVASEICKDRDGKPQNAKASKSAQSCCKQLHLIGMLVAMAGVR